MKILLVEDDPRMRQLVQRGLTDEGHAVVASADGTDALARMSGAEFDVVILDVMLPGISGIDVVRQMRGGGKTTAVLMLTARDSRSDIIAGLDAGADDYLTKPFAFDVLLARLRALGRRAPLEHGICLRVSDLMLDMAAHTATRAGELASLTRTEFSVLECLMRRAGRVVSRRALTESVWGNDREITSNTIDAFIRLLRQKVDGPGHRPLIRTVRGVGYMIGDDARE